MYYTYSVSNESEEIDEKPNFEFELPHSKKIPDFKTIFPEDEKIDKDAVKFIKEPLEIAIDDYFNFEDGAPPKKEKEIYDISANTIYRQKKFEKDAKKRFGIKDKKIFDNVDLYKEMNILKGTDKWNFDPKNKGVFKNKIEVEIPPNEIAQNEIKEIFGNKKKRLEIGIGKISKT